MADHLTSVLDDLKAKEVAAQNRLIRTLPHDHELVQIAEARKALEKLVGAAKEPVKGPETAKPSARAWKLRGPAVKPAQVREYAKELGMFTRAQIAQHFDRSDSWATKAIAPFLEKGTVREVGKAKYRDPMLYEYVDPKTTPLTEAHSNVAVLEGQVTRRTPVPGTGNRGKKATKEIRPLLDAARRQGWDITQKSGHIEVRNPRTGQSTKVSASPSDRYAHREVRREFERMGIRVA